MHIYADVSPTMSGGTLSRVSMHRIAVLATLETLAHAFQNLAKFLINASTVSAKEEINSVGNTMSYPHLLNSALVTALHGRTRNGSDIRACSSQQLHAHSCLIDFPCAHT